MEKGRKRMKKKVILLKATDEHNYNEKIQKDQDKNITKSDR